ncbi:MAG: hypothetical protein RIK87_30600 [Fuerstiella sp.]
MEEKTELKETVRAEIRDEWIGEDADMQDLTDDEAQQAMDEGVHQVKLVAAVVLAVGNIFLPLSSLFFFCSGAFGAFKLASNLGDE